MSPHSHCTSLPCTAPASPSSHSTSVSLPISTPSSSSSPSLPLHRPLLSQDIKKPRNSKRLSLFVPPSPASLGPETIGPGTSNSLHPAHLLSRPRSRNPKGLALTPSPSFPPPSNSLSSRRPFTPAPLSSASVVVASKRTSLILLEDALPTARLPLPPSTPGHRSISAYYSDYSLECGAASPYTSEPVCVLPNLYLGAEHNALDHRTLQRLGINAVLNVAIEIAKDGKAPELAPVFSTSTSTPALAKQSLLHPASAFTSMSKSDIVFKNLSWTHQQQNLLRDFPAAFAFIEETTTKGGKVLVHCQLGVSRSASLVIAYVMRVRGMGLNDAYEFVKDRSEVISPNMSLMYQLAEFEKALQTERTGNRVDLLSEFPLMGDPWNMSEDEPPYPFSAMAMATTPTTGTTLASPNTTSSHSRPEWCKRPWSQEGDGIEDHQPSTKPFQSPSLRGEAHSGLCSPPQLNRMTSRRSSLATSIASPDRRLSMPIATTPKLSPPTPTTAQFSSLSLSMTPPSLKGQEPLRSVMAMDEGRRSSRSIPGLAFPPAYMLGHRPMATPRTVETFPKADALLPLPSLPDLVASSSSSTSSASLSPSASASSLSVSTVPSSVYSTPSSSSSASSVLSFTPSRPNSTMSWTKTSPHPLDSVSLTTKPLPKIFLSGHLEEKEQEDEEDERGAGAFSPRNSGTWTMVPATGASGFGSHSRMMVDASSLADLLQGPSLKETPPKVVAAVVRDATMTLVEARSSDLTESVGTVPVPDYIFSPRRFTPAYTTRTFGDFYQALCMEG